MASDYPSYLHRDAFHNDLAFLHYPKQGLKSQEKCLLYIQLQYYFGLLKAQTFG